MSRILLVVLIAAASATAQAEPAPAPPRSCPARGTPIVEIEVRVEQGAKLPTSTTKVYSTGAWTKQRVSAAHAQRPLDRGCLDSAQLQDIKDALAAPWKLTRQDITCKAMSLSHTIWKIRGKQVFDQRLCGAEQLDDRSAKSLETIRQALRSLPLDGDSADDAVR